MPLVHQADAEEISEAAERVEDMMAGHPDAMHMLRPILVSATCADLDLDRDGAVTEDEWVLALTANPAVIPTCLGRCVHGEQPPVGILLPPWR